MNHENFNEPDPTDEASLLIDEHGCYTTDTGVHLRLRPREPLYLTNSLVLANLEASGYAAARAARQRRLGGFLEAGQTWAARRIGLEFDNHSVGMPCGRSIDNELNRLITSDCAQLAVAVVMEADLCEFLGIETGFGHTFGTSTDPSIAYPHPELPTPPGGSPALGDVPVPASGARWTPRALTVRR